jgi:hypothetical protein
MDILHEVKRPGLNFQVYKTYLRIVDKRGLFGFLLPKTSSIPLRNIAEVEAKAGSEELIIKTNDGQTRKYRLGGLGKAATGLRDAILENL